MVKKNRLSGRWIHLYTNRCKLLPTLGSYKISKLEKPQQRVTLPDLPKLDYQHRDLFTKRVCSSAVQLKGAPDIACLKRKGMCLATEAEVLDSQRYTTDAETFDDSSSEPATPTFTWRTPTIPVVRLRQLLRSTQKRTGQTFLEHTMNATLAHQMENERRNLIQRQIEGRLMTSRAYYYKKLVNTSLCMSNADSVTRKYVSEALDEQHREILSKFMQPPKLSTDRSSTNSLFREWKNTAINIVDQQAEEDLRKVADFLKFIKQTKQTKTVKQKRRPSAKVCPVKMGIKDSSKTVATKEHVTATSLLELPVLKIVKSPSQRKVKPTPSTLTDLQSTETASMVSSAETSSTYDVNF